MVNCSNSSSLNGVNKLNLNERVKNDKRTIAKAITTIENGGAEALKLLKQIYPQTGTAHLIGITGPPGVGKSTLIDALIGQIRKSGLKVGVLAIDPSSPFSGGAILGDRIRMQAHTLDSGVFIRSMANRGHFGGIALAAYDAIRVLEAFAYDIIIIETVGVGQSELAIAQMADTTILALMPGSGDDIQAIKSGIMEIGDIFVINKGDLPGANKATSNIVQSLDLIQEKADWMPPVLISIAQEGIGIEELWQAIGEHFKFLKSSGKLEQRRKHRIKSELAVRVAAKVRQSALDFIDNSSNASELVNDVWLHKTDPHLAAEKLIKSIV